MDSKEIGMEYTYLDNNLSRVRADLKAACEATTPRG